jgi:hypothetical protein
LKRKIEAYFFLLQATDRAIGTFAFLFVLKSASYLLVEIEKIQQEECEREKDSKL